MSHELLPPINRYVLLQDPFLRFIIVHSVMVLDGKLNTNIVAWSGSKWVPIGGAFQVCNFRSPESAHSYAKEAGLQYGYELSEAARPTSAPSRPASGADK